MRSMQHLAFVLRSDYFALMNMHKSHKLKMQIQFYSFAKE